MRGAGEVRGLARAFPLDCETGLLSMGEEANGKGRAGGRGVSWLEAAYRRYAAHVYTLCLRLVASASAAEDTTVQVFVRLSHELTGRWDETRTLARLRELAVEEALALLRAGVRKDEPPDIATVARAKEGGEVLPLNPDTLEALAARLPDELRVAFVLHDQEG